MNDLVTPFLAVFLSETLQGQLENWQLDSLTEVSSSKLAAFACLLLRCVVCRCQRFYLNSYHVLMCGISMH